MVAVRLTTLVPLPKNPHMAVVRPINSITAPVRVDEITVAIVLSALVRNVSAFTVRRYCGVLAEEKTMVFLTPGMGGSRTYTLDDAAEVPFKNDTPHAGTFTPVVSAVVTPRRRSSGPTRKSVGTRPPVAAVDMS